MLHKFEFADYCIKLGIDRRAMKQIRGVLRQHGFRSPYDIGDGRVLSIVTLKWQNIQLKRRDRESATLN